MTSDAPGASGSIVDLVTSGCGFEYAPDASFATGVQIQKLQVIR